MKKLFYILIFLILANTVSASAYRIIKGEISSGKKGVEGIVVTDGKSFAKTDKHGRFQLMTDGNQKYVYYSLPSGYESPREKGIPIFYKKIEDQNDTYNFEISKVNIPQTNHTFIVWADPQVIDPEEFKLLDKVVEDVNQTKEKYDTYFHGVSCGDMVFDRLNLFGDYKKALSKMDFSFYQVIGNHDLDYTNKTNESASQSYQSYFGPDYYSYNVGNIHYVVLNNVFYYGYSYHYMGYLSQQQLDWLTHDLGSVKEGSTIVVALHIPTKYVDSDLHPGMEKRQKNSLINDKAFYQSLKGYNVHILAGHSHTQWNTIINDSIYEHTHAAASAAWWQGEIGLDGTPKGYTVYEVEGDNLKWYFKGVGLTKDDQFKVYPIGSDIDNPDAFVANVYNYDPAWTVQWYEDGVLAGNMEQYWGVDPLARELYQPGKNEVHKWLSYDKTNHIFKAIPKNKNARLKIEVIDRFGNKYIRNISDKP